MAAYPDPLLSPLRRENAAPLDAEKFRDADRTAKGEPRAKVPLGALTTLWFNTGTLCNLACATCYIESSPTNDALAYISAAEVAHYLDEIERDRLPVREIGLTGGEPFMNREIVSILSDALGRGFEVLVLTNAMRPMRRFGAALLDLRAAYGDQLTLRVSLDHHMAQVHEAERGTGTWDKATEGLQWLAAHGFSLAVAGRMLPGEEEAVARAGYQRLFAELGVPVNAVDPARLVLFPEMDVAADIAEISEGCWAILGTAPASVMCASSRMVVKRKGEPNPRVAACTLLPYDPQFDLGETLAEASRTVLLNHPHCARFCVLGGASCSA